MADLIRALNAHGHTYESDGSVYFRIATLPQYGRLARLDHDGLKTGARIDADNYEKDNARDFVLWKATKPAGDGPPAQIEEPSWDYGFGRGRPGWHLECSAMALRLLGEPPIDIHCGGVDLIFPHHENEIAQSEGATNRPFARFWMHVEHLLIDEEKMSKSLGNVFNLPDVQAKGYRPSTLRYLLLSNHYRKQLKFSWDAMNQAEEAMRRLADFLRRLDEVKTPGSHEEIAAKVSTAEAQFREAMERDLNTAAALGAAFDLVRLLNAAIDRGELGTGDVPPVKGAFDRFDSVLGVVALRQQEDRQTTLPPEEIDGLVVARQEARRRRDFAEGDRIRQQLWEAGIALEDSPAGTRWKRR
jgi:cysteinyl-tRNA synthetase